MRKEDKVRLPQRLELSLPDGFYVERRPDEYVLYASYSVVDEHHRPRGVMTDIIAVFTGDSNASEIEGSAQEAAVRLAKKLEHQHLGEK